MKIAHPLGTAAAVVLLTAGWPTLATTPVPTSIQPATGLVDAETPLALTGYDFVPGMRLALVAGGGHELAHLPLSSVGGIALAGGFAYVATDAGLVALDISRPGSPVVAGSAPLGGAPGYLRAADGLVLAGVIDGGGPARLLVFEAVDPARPVPVAELAVDAAAAQFGYAAGYLYLPSAASGFDVVDLRNPAAPATIARYREPGLRVEAIEVVGGRAFVAGAFTVPDVGVYPLVEVFDVSDPRVPQLVASADLPGTAGRLAPIADGVLVSHSHGLFLVTCDDELRVRRQAVRQGGSTPSFVTTNGTSAAWFHGVVEVLDITDPLAPVVRGRFPVTPDEPASGNPIALRDGYTYWGLGSGLEVYDACDPYAAAPVHERAHRWGLKDVAFSADRVHFLDDAGQLHVTEVVDPAAPRALGSTLDLAFGDLVALDGDLAYVAGRTWSWYDRGVLSIVDESVPAQMPVVGTLSLAGPPAAIDADGPRVYLGGWSEIWGGSLEIVDATRPREPLAAGRIEGLPRPGTITAAGGALYYFSDGMLTVLDVSDPARPAIAATVPGLGWPTDSARAGSLLFVTEITPFAYEAGSLKVFDIASPFAPSLVAEVPIDGFPLSVHANDTRLAVGTDRAGVLIFQLELGLPPRLTETLADTGAWIGLLDRFASVHRSGTWTIYPINPPVESTSSSSGTCGASTIPAGVARGLYDVVTTCPHGHAFRMRDAYRACLRHQLTATLEALPPPVPPTRWRLEVGGDEHFFGRPKSHAARLLLPPLPASLERRYALGGVPGTLSIALSLAPGAGAGVVHLVGSDRAALDALWETMKASGGIALRAIDDRHYGDFQLAVTDGGFVGIDGKAQFQYAYTFENGVLAAASAHGPGVDLVFEATGTDDIRCLTPASARYSGARGTR